MNLFKTSLILLMSFPLFASADVLIERELFNARNGETYVCKLHDNLQTELVNEGVSVGSFASELSSTPENIKKWVTELKALSKNNKLPMQSKVITKYTHRGLKQYSVYSGKNKIPFYTLQGNPMKTRKSKLGSLERQAKESSGNVNRLRGQVDYACKMATLKL